MVINGTILRNGGRVQSVYNDEMQQQSNPYINQRELECNKRMAMFWFCFDLTEDYLDCIPYVVFCFSSVVPICT